MNKIGFDTHNNRLHFELTSGGEKTISHLYIQYTSEIKYFKGKELIEVQGSLNKDALFRMLLSDESKLEYLESIETWIEILPFSKSFNDSDKIEVSLSPFMSVRGNYKTDRFRISIDITCSYGGWHSKVRFHGDPIVFKLYHPISYG